MQVIPLKTQHTRTRVDRFRWRVILITILVNILGYTLVTWALGHSRQDYHVRAETTAQNSARRLQQNIAHTLEIVGMGLLATKVEIERQQINGGINDAALNEFLNHRHPRLPEVGGIQVVNANGLITHDSDKALVSEARIDDQEHFQFLRNHPLTGLYISKPLLDRASGNWILLLSRRLNHPDGSFAGVLNGTINLGYFQKLFSSLEIGPLGAVSLRSSDLGIVARHPALPETTLGISSLNAWPEWEGYLRSARMNWLSTEQSPVDGVTRMTAVHKVTNFPLYVVVGLAPDDYFAQWWQAAATASESLLLFTMVTALLSLSLYHHFLAHMVFAANRCAIRSQPCRLTGFGSRVGIPTSSRYRTRWSGNTGAAPKISWARCAGRSAPT